jgi:hypothetical protein
MKKFTLIFTACLFSLIGYAKGFHKADTTCTANITITASSDTVCSGYGAVLDNNNDSTIIQSRSPQVVLTASGGVSYRWSTGSTTDTIMVSVGGEYYVTATDSNGCTGTDSISVIGAPYINMTLSSSATDSICSNPSGIITFTALVQIPSYTIHGILSPTITTWSVTGDGIIVPNVGPIGIGLIEVYYPNPAIGSTVTATTTWRNLSQGAQQSGVYNCSQTASITLNGCSQCIAPTVSISPVSEINISQLTDSVSFVADSTICPYTQVPVMASGAALYSWSPLNLYCNRQ